MQTYSFNLAYEELISRFHHLPYISLDYLQSPSVLWLRADPGHLFSHKWWLLLSEPQAGSPSCQSTGRSKHSMPVSMTYLDFEDNFESASICSNKTVSHKGRDFAFLQKTESQNNLGWNRPVRSPSPTAAKSATKSCSWVPHLHIFQIPPGMVTQPLPWAVCFKLDSPFVEEFFS